MSNGKKPVKDFKGKIVKNLYQKNGNKSGLQGLIKSLNKITGISVAGSVSGSALKNASNKINNVLPFAGAPGKKKKD